MTSGGPLAFLSYTCVLITSLPLCRVCAFFSEQDDIFKSSAKISVYAKKQLYELEGNGVELGPCSPAAIRGANKHLRHQADSSPLKRSWFGFFLSLLENADSIPTKSVLLSPCKQADLGAAWTAAANWKRYWR